MNRPGVQGQHGPRDVGAVCAYDFSLRAGVLLLVDDRGAAAESSERVSPGPRGTATLQGRRLAHVRRTKQRPRGPTMRPSARTMGRLYVANPPCVAGLGDAQG